MSLSAQYIFLPSPRVRACWQSSSRPLLWKISIRTGLSCLPCIFGTNLNHWPCGCSPFLREIWHPSSLARSRLGFCLSGLQTRRGMIVQRLMFHSFWRFVYRFQCDRGRNSSKVLIYDATIISRPGQLCPWMMCAWHLTLYVMVKSSWNRTASTWHPQAVYLSQKEFRLWRLSIVTHFLWSYGLLLFCTSYPLWTGRAALLCCALDEKRQLYAKLFPL